MNDIANDEVVFNKRVSKQLRDPFSIYNTFYWSDGSDADGGDSDGPDGPGSSGGDGGDGSSDGMGHGSMDAGAGGPGGPGSAAAGGGVSPGMGGTGDGDNGDSGGGALSTSISPTTEYEYNTDLDLVSITTNTFRDTPDGLAIDSNRTTTGYLDFDFDSLTTTYKTTPATIKSGTLASHLYDMGISAPTAHTIEATIEAGIAIALGKPIAAIAPTALALQAQGIIDAKTSQSIQAVGAVASFGMGFINGMQALDAINEAKSLGAIDNVSAALMAGATLFSMYSGFMGFSEKMGSLGFSPSPGDLSDFGVSSSGDGDVYIGGTKITFANIQGHMSAFALYMAKKNRADSLKSDIYGHMAGSLFYNSFAAGGDLFDPSISPITNHLAAVGKDTHFSSYTKMSFLQNDFIGVAVNPYNTVRAFSV